MMSEQATSYVSCIKMCGHPIPPPYLDDQVRREMKEYKKLAISVEKKLALAKTERVVSRLGEILQKFELECYDQESNCDGALGNVTHPNNGQCRCSKKTECTIPPGAIFEEFSSTTCHNCRIQNLGDDHYVLSANDLQVKPIQGDQTKSNMMPADTDFSFTYKVGNVMPKIGLKLGNTFENVDRNEKLEVQPTFSNTFNKGIHGSSSANKEFDGNFFPSIKPMEMSVIDEGDTSEAELRSIATYHTESTDISPYMRSKLTSSNSITSVEPSTNLTSLSNVAKTGNILKEASKPTHSSVSSSARSSPTVIEMNDFNSPPKLVRSNSYTLEAPSPALLSSQQKQQAEESQSDDSSIEHPPEAPFVDDEDDVITKEKLDNVCEDVTNEKQSHLQRYLQALSSTKPEHYAQHNSYFPSVIDRISTSTSLPSSSRMQFFPDVLQTYANRINSSKNLTQVSTSSLSGADAAIQAKRCPSVSSQRSVTSFDEVFRSQEQAFEKSREDLQQQHQNQIEKLLKHQWKEQVEIQRTFVRQQEENFIKMSSNDTFSESSLSSSKTYDKSTERAESFSEHSQLVQESNKVQLNITPELKAKFSSLPALIKGHLTRKLMKTEHVQSQIQTIKDTLSFALMFQSETPFKTKKVSAEDVALHHRLISQVTSACHHLHDIFFKTSKVDQMKIITNSEMLLERRRLESANSHNEVINKKRRLSSATIKCLARKTGSESSMSCTSNFSTKNIVKNLRPKSFSVSAGGVHKNKQITRKGSETVRRRLYSNDNKENGKSRSIITKNIITNKQVQHWR